MKTTLLLLLMCLFQLQIQAQTQMFIKQSSGNVTTYDLMAIDKLTFSPGQMKVNLMGGTEIQFPTANVQRFTFNQTNTKVVDIHDDELHGIFAYPNPCAQDVSISFKSKNSGKVTIDVIDASGKIVKKFNEQSKVGKNIIPLNLSDINQGLYLIRVQNELDMETIHILKN